MHQYPVSMVFGRSVQKDAEEGSLRVAFSVPRKNFKKAVERNLLKRRMREALRLNQWLVTGSRNANEQHTLQLMFIYQSKNIECYHSIEKAIVRLLKKIAQ